MGKIIGVLALPGAQLLDVSGPLDVFAEANVRAGSEVYVLKVIATRPGPVQASSGVRLMPDMIAGERPRLPFDTLLVAGAPNAADFSLEPAVAAWLATVIPKSRRFGSVCTGAFVLAQLGLLDGRRITTHWSAAAELGRRHPKIRIEADAIHVKDGRLRTAAGVTAGLDLALALVEEDLGREVAVRVAHQLVMYFKRPSGQTPFMRSGDFVPAGRAALQDLQRWAAAHLSADLSIEKMAGRLGLSPRHFARLFHQEVGMTPAAWVEEARIAAGRTLLEKGGRAPKQVADACGYASIDVFRRAFVKRVGMTPAAYQRAHVVH